MTALAAVPSWRAIEFKRRGFVPGFFHVRPVAMTGRSPAIPAGRSKPGNVSGLVRLTVLTATSANKGHSGAVTNWPRQKKEPGLGAANVGSLLDIRCQGGGAGRH
jgi:hypothetical protein